MRTEVINLTVTTGANSFVEGNTFGIRARNEGTGALSVTANGAAAPGSNNDGIFANNSATGTNLTVERVQALDGATYGIRARNYGSGYLTVTANGDVTGTATTASMRGIPARHQSRR